MTTNPVHFQCLLLFGWLLLAGCQGDDVYPNRPITLICPWAVGGGTDRVSRQMAFYLERELGVPVNVVNATGGRGVTGHSRGLRATPDGYTLTMMTVELNMLHWQDLTTISWQDATPLISINEDAAALFVRTDAPWSDIKALLVDVRNTPGQLTASGTASGAIWHVALVGWLQKCGLPGSAVTWIPMGGSGPSLQELASGGLGMVCCSLPEADSLLRQGRVRCLGVMSDDRIPGYPDVPTLRELGTDWTTVGWRGLAVPRGTPPARVVRLVTALERIVTGESAVNGASFPQYMATENFNNRWRGPDDFRRFLAEDDAQYGRLLGRDAFARLTTRGIGPMTFPSVLFALLGVLLISLLLTAFRRRSRVKHAKGSLGVADGLASSRPNVPSGETPAATSLSTGGDRDIWGVAIMAAGAVAYLVFSEPVGFVLTAAAILFVLLWWYGTRLAVSALVVVLLVPGLYHVFAHLLRVPLPRGVFGW